MTDIKEITDEQLLTAIKCYKRQRRKTKEYILSHMDEHLARCRKSYQKMKDDPERLARFREKQRIAAAKYYAKKRAQKANADIKE